MRETYFLTAWRPASPKSRCWQHLFLLEARRETLLRASLLASRGCQQPLVSLGLHASLQALPPITSSDPWYVCVLSVSSKDALVGLRAHPNAGWAHVDIYLNYICWDLISKKGHILKFWVVMSWTVFPRKICWSPDPQHIRICLYLKIGS